MNLQVGVKVLIKNNDDAYLFVRRKIQVSTDKNQTSWDIPGGRINPDETLDKALQREVKEEIGYSLTAIPTLISAQDIMVLSKDLHVVRLTYTTKEDVSDITLSDEHDDHVWLSLDKLDTVTLEPYLAQVIETLKNQ